MDERIPVVGVDYPRQVLQAVLLGGEPRHQLLMCARVVHPHHRNPLVHTPNLLDSSRYPIHQYEPEGVGVVTTLAMAGEAADTCPSPDLRAAVLAVTEAAGGARTWSASGRAVLIGELDRAITVLTSVRADLLIARSS